MQINPFSLFSQIQDLHKAQDYPIISQSFCQFFSGSNFKRFLQLVQLSRHLPNLNLCYPFSARSIKYNSSLPNRFTIFNDWKRFSKTKERCFTDGATNQAKQNPEFRIHKSAKERKWERKDLFLITKLNSSRILPFHSSQARNNNILPLLIWRNAIS